MRDYCDFLKNEYKLNFSLLATSGELISGRFIDFDKDLYKPDVDIFSKGYYTNSFHIDVDSRLPGYKKIQLGFQKQGLPLPTVGTYFSGVQVVIERTVFKKISRNVGDNVGKDVGKDVGSDVGNLTQKKIIQRYNSIINLIRSNPSITAKQISELLSVSDRTIERDLSKMQETGNIIREGDKNGGRWIILK